MKYTKEELDKAIEERRWPPPVMQCKICKSTMQSQYPGEFISCKCGASFVDQTPYYSRYGGDVVEFSPTKHGNDDGGRDAE